MSLSARVLRTIRRRSLVAPGGRVLVALSGGGDSVALVHLLRELEADGHVRVAGLAHFNHRLRGAESDADEAFCRAMATGMDLPYEAGSADVRAVARERRGSIEDTARTLRYAFLGEAADRLGADVIAVGHSRDDQTETFLLRLIRGSGPRGLAAILPRAGRVVRPLLDVTRAELRAYAAERGYSFREDASNADLGVPRNRVRHELIPYLEREFSAGVSAVLAREASICRDDDDFLRERATELARTIVLEEKDGPGGEVLVDAAAIGALPPAMAARVALLALKAGAPQAFVGFDSVERFLEFAGHGRVGAALSLPGQQAVHTGTKVRLGPEPPRGQGPRPGDGRVFANGFAFPLAVPGEVRLEAADWVISAEAVERREPRPGSHEGARPGHAVEVDAGPLVLPLTVRSRRPGDRFSPPGLGHRKKLQDYLTDRKIPRRLRDSLPLVVDAGGRIVWVVGEALSADFRVTERSRGVILLRSRRLGGLG